MRHELRYQEKIHVISDMPRNEKIKFPAFSPPIIYIYIYNNNNNNIWVPSRTDSLSRNG
jgi:hypothetical protein